MFANSALRTGLATLERFLPLVKARSKRKSRLCGPQHYHSHISSCLLLLYRLQLRNGMLSDSSRGSGRSADECVSSRGADNAVSPMCDDSLECAFHSWRGLGGGWFSRVRR